MITPPKENVALAKQILGERSIRNVDDFIGFANEIHAAEFKLPLIRKRVIKARAQRELLEHMLLFTSALVSGQMNGSGLAGKTIVGAKGIGKSTAAQNFVSLVEAIFPGVIGIFVNLEGVTTGEAHFSKKSLFGNLIDFLEDEREIKLDAKSLGVRKFDSAETIFMKYLESTNQYIFIFIDELDEFYVNKETPIYIQTLQELQLLGNSDAGRIGTILCGSSAYLTDLITANRNSYMTERFKLLQGAVPNLNGSKFKTERVYSNLPTDLLTVEAILAQRLSASGSQTESLQRARAVAFFSGSTVRTVEREFFTVSGHSDRSMHSGTLTTKLMEKETKLLFELIMKALIEINKHLLEKFKLTQDDFINVVSSTPWEQELRPVSWSMIEALWPAVRSAYPNSTTDADALATMVLHLSDTSWICPDGVVAGHPLNVFPKTMCGLLEFKIARGLDPSLKQRAFDFLVETAPLAGKGMVSTVAGSYLGKLGEDLAAATLSTFQKDKEDK